MKEQLFISSCLDIYALPNSKIWRDFKIKIDSRSFGEIFIFDGEKGYCPENNIGCIFTKNGISFIAGNDEIVEIGDNKTTTLEEGLKAIDNFLYQYFFGKD